ncbi:MAG: indolepyruvate oxidoreductase subunit beta [Thermodesulfobacteriota bacterium]
MDSNKDYFNLIITGVGGQGNVLVSQLLGQAFVSKGFFTTIGETYGASQRGGSVMSHLRLSKKKQLSPLIPKGKADILVALEPVEALRVLTYYGNGDTVVFCNTRPIYPIDVISGDEAYPDFAEIEKFLAQLAKKIFYIPATERAMEMGNPILGNMIIIGALLTAQILPLTLEEFQETLAANFKSPRLETNLQALKEGQNLVSRAGIEPATT